MTINIAFCIKELKHKKCMTKCMSYMYVQCSPQRIQMQSNEQLTLACINNISLIN